jgi:hypothetical protein
MSSDLLLRDESGRPVAAISFDALYAHPYRVGIIFRTPSKSSSSPAEFDVRTAVTVSYEEFARFAGWVKATADAYSKEGFLNKRVWPDNIAKHANATGQPLQDPVVIKKADGTAVAVALENDSDLPGMFTLTLRSVSSKGIGDAESKELFRILLTQDEANELATHLAIKRRPSQPVSGRV